MALPQQLAALQLDQDNVSEPPKSLLDLPELVIRRILDFLLEATEVSQPAVLSDDRPWYQYRSYNFEVAILRTSRGLYDLGSRVFAANHFIQISTNDPQVLRLLAGHIPRYWTSTSVKRAKSIKMHIFVRAGAYKVNIADGGPRTCLICLIDLQDFVRAMKKIELFGDSQLNFVLQLKPADDGQPLPVKIQRTLLRPLHQLHLLKQSCTVRGAVDAHLARQTEHIMTPQLYWFRARDHDICEVVYNICEAAKEAYIVEYFTTAINLYYVARNVLQTVDAGKDFFRYADDPVLERYIHSLARCICVNEANAVFSFSLLQGSNKRAPWFDRVRDIYTAMMSLTGSEEQSKFATHGENIWGSVHGCWIHIGSNRPGEGLQAADTLRSYPRQGLPDDLAHVLGTTIRTTRDWCDLPSRKGRAAIPKMLRKLNAIVPRLPITSIDCVGVSRSSSIAHERYVLKALDYQGDMYEDRIVQEPGRSISATGEVIPVDFDRNASDRYILQCREYLSAGDGEKESRYVLRIDSPFAKHA